jgi:hypothetical protein
MGMPTLLTVAGTASAVWFPDWMQVPFQIGIGLVTNTTGVNGTAVVEYSFQKGNFTSDVGGTTTPTWFPLIAETGVNATSLMTTPCQMLRVNVVTATATSSWSVMFVQATFGR